MKKEKTSLVTFSKNVTFELQCLNTAIADANRVKQYLMSKDVLCTPVTIREACSKQFRTIGSDFKQKELTKIAAFEKQFGKIKTLELDSDARINQTIKEDINDLANGLPALNYLSAEYFDLLDYSGAEIKALAEFNTAYFEMKHSIVLNDGHIKAIECINQMFEQSGLPAHLFINKFSKFNFEKKVFELDVQLYDPQKKIIDFISETDIRNSKYQHL